MADLPEHEGKKAAVRTLSFTKLDVNDNMKVREFANKVFHLTEFYVRLF